MFWPGRIFIWTGRGCFSEDLADAVPRRFGNSHIFFVLSDPFGRRPMRPPAVTAKAFGLPATFSVCLAGVDLSVIGPAPPFSQVLQLYFLAAVARPAGFFALFGRQLPLFCRGESPLPPAGIFSGRPCAASRFGPSL